ncbi:MAG: hypothetical protein EXR79_10700 [Myxococcales bacterium]|nr:hypothetical protein [Myxococcales bacterium]
MTKHPLMGQTGPWLASGALALAAAVPAATAAVEPPRTAQASTAAPATPARIAALQAQWKLWEKAKAVPLDALRVGVELGDLLARSGDAKGAALAWQHTADAFTRSGHAAGSHEAAVAADALLHGLQADVARVLESHLVVRPGVAPGQRGVDIFGQLAAWADTVLGPLPKPKAGEAAGPRAGGLADRLRRVLELRSQPATWATVLWLGRVLARPADDLRALATDTWLPEERGALDPVREQARVHEDQALIALESAWRQAEAEASKDPTALELRLELSRLRPQQFPVVGGAALDPDALTPQQQEASKLAGLAQQATKLGLRILYLQKAVKLDPSNPGFHQLLQAAEAEAALQPGR